MNAKLFLTSILFAFVAFSVPGFAAKPDDSNKEQGALNRVMKEQDRRIAVQILEDVRLLDACVDQWAIENNKRAGDLPTPQDLAVYLKKGTRLQMELAGGGLKDALGNSMILRGVDSVPLVSKITVQQFSTVVKPDFWGPFNEGGALAAAPAPEPAPEKPAAPENPVTKLELRNCAVRVLEEIRLIDAAIDQWAIELNKQAGAQAGPKDLLPYVKPGTRLHRELSAGRLNDILGNPITIPPVDTIPVINKATAEKLAPVAEDDFWGPYKAK